MSRAISGDAPRILKGQADARRAVRLAEAKLDAARLRRDLIRTQGGPGWPSRLGAANLVVFRLRSQLVASVRYLYLDPALDAPE